MINRSWLFVKTVHSQLRADTVEQSGEGAFVELRQRFFDEPRALFGARHLKCIASSKPRDATSACPSLHFEMRRWPARKYEPILKSVNENLLLAETELGILFTQHSESRALYAADIAAELDCSGQLVGRRAKNVALQA